MTDSVIDFGNNAEINGQVFSNGTACTQGMSCPTPLGDPGQVSVKATANSATPVRCLSGGSISAAIGSIDVPGCATSANTNSAINIPRARDVFSDIQSSCSASTASARCTTYSTNWTVTIDNDKVFWCPGVLSQPCRSGNYLQMTGSSSAALLVDGARIHVNQLRALTGRLTIAGRSTRVGDVASYMYIDSNLRRQDPSRDLLGLVNDGAIIVKFTDVLQGYDVAPCSTTAVTQIQAAMISVTAGLQLEPEYLASNFHAGMGFGKTCPNIDIVGSIATHNAPSLFSSVGVFQGSAPVQIGYVNRSYSWDPLLGKTAPPFFPVAEPFRERRSKAANMSCLGPELLDWSCS